MVRAGMGHGRITVSPLILAAPPARKPYTSLASASRQGGLGQAGWCWTGWTGWAEWQSGRLGSSRWRVWREPTIPLTSSTRLGRGPVLWEGGRISLCQPRDHQMPTHRRPSPSWARLCGPATRYIVHLRYSRLLMRFPAQSVRPRVPDDPRSSTDLGVHAPRPPRGHARALYYVPSRPSSPTPPPPNPPIAYS